MRRRSFPYVHIVDAQRHAERDRYWWVFTEVVDVTIFTMISDEGGRWLYLLAVERGRPEW